MGNPVVHFEITGKDTAALQSFYRDAFDWRLVEQPGYAMAHPDADTGISGGIGPAIDAGPGHVTFYIGVDDLAAALARIETLGGRAVVGPIDVPGGPSIALFADPEGHVVGLVKTPADS